MEIKELQTRINKKQEQIKKLEAKVARLTVNDPWDDLRRAQFDLRDAQITLDKYQNALNVELNKENEFENNRIDVIWEFLLSYKEQYKEYIRNNVNVLNEYYKVNTEICNWHNNNSYRVHNGEMTREEYYKVYNELDKREKELADNIHPYTKLVAKRNYPETIRKVDEVELEKLLLKDIKQRYFELINQVTKYTGIITDADNLKIHNGELNGIVIGVKGNAKIQTIGAGGYNIQCFHYRTLVHKVD